jgi:formamidopyrimidine-DNA glycosylase
VPELPDVELYVAALRHRIAGVRLDRVRLASPFVLRSVTPALADAHGRTVCSVSRLGKRIVMGLDEELFLVVHLMIAGRFRWKASGAAVPARFGLAAFDFSTGTLLLTEAGTKKRASLTVVQGAKNLAALDPGGIEVASATLETFREALTRESHTLKRALTDPHLFSGIGNAYSDEILHAARLSPLALTRRLTDDEVVRLFEAARSTLEAWSTRLVQESGDAFPEKVTAFRPGMAVHGRFGQRCPACGTPVQRLRYADNEANYCPGCQTGGRLLADRSLSRLLGRDWPRSLDELERLKRERTRQ